MSTFNLAPFGEVSAGQYYSQIASVEGQEIHIELDLEEIEALDEALPTLNALSSFLPKLNEHTQRAHNAILRAFHEDHEWAKAYVDHHLAELSNEDLKAIIGTNPEQASAEQLAKNLRLHAISSAPLSEDDEESHLASFDFTVGKEYTNYVLTVKFALDATISEIAMES
ncbi:DUF2004 domain-containing protein [Corynebacterium freiburgense]|uniref:DUF2004 domain-containing protein n=1 Tax=Corynebacterium freiburgense TaxID=556548 RepID=UPI00040642DA|nr:DUF2004 domain-containing protein [Corynebacterium freiburgense]WJZ03735.1 hypothetical protein CFREI_12390 [Corynebacterium freiburgense]